VLFEVVIKGIFFVYYFQFLQRCTGIHIIGS